MANINEILARAAALRDETALNSISPERAGGIMYDTLLALNELWLQQGAALVISKIYASVAAMEADTAPVSDLTGKPLRPGQIVVIASSDSDNGSVYRYNGTESPSWSLVGSIGNLDPVDSLDSDSTTLPLAAHQGKVLDGKISQLGQEVKGKVNNTISISAWGTNWDGQELNAVGQYGYNPSNNTLKRCIDYRGTAETSYYETVALNTFTTYLYAGRSYFFDGSKLVDKVESIGKWVNSFGIINGFDVTKSKALNATDGTTTSVPECSVTDYIDVSAFSIIAYTNICIMGASSPYGMAFFNSSKQYISGNGFNLGQSFAGYKMTFLEVPNGAKYARFTIWREDDSSFGVEAIKQSFCLLANSAATYLSEFIQEKEDVEQFELLLQIKASKLAFTESPGAIDWRTGNVSYVAECHYTDYVDISGNPSFVANFLVVISPTSFVGMAFYDSNKIYISGRRALVGSTISYERTVFVAPKNAKYVRFTLWNSSYSGFSYLDGLFYMYGYPVAQIYSDTPNRKLDIPATTWLATTRNYILKLEGENLMHSDDLGKTWKTLENIIGDIVFVHWFSDGTCLICGEEKIYKTRDFNSLIEIPVYDLDGSLFAGGSHNFFHEFSYNNPYNLIDGKETVVWSDYDNSTGYVSRVWMSNDNGASIHCILKNGESIVDGSVLSITHFHHCVWDKYEQCLWISTGDYNNGNKLIKGTCTNGVWSFTTIAQGNEFKFGMILFDEIYLYLITDITSGDAPRGIVKVAKASISDANSYSYIYKNPQNVSFISYYENNTIKVLFPDGAQSNRGKVYIANGDANFAEYDFVCSDGQSRILGQSVGPNYNGDLIAITYSGYGSGYKLNMPRYLLSEGMKNAGFANFSKMRLV